MTGSANPADGFPEGGGPPQPTSGNNPGSTHISVMENSAELEVAAATPASDAVPAAAAGDQTAHAARAAALREKRPRAQRGKVAVAWLVNAVKQLGEPHGSAPHDVAKFAARALGLPEEQLELPVRLGLARAQRQGLLTRATAGKYMIASGIGEIETAASCGVPPPKCRKRVMQSCKRRKRSSSRRRRSCSRKRRRRSCSRPRRRKCSKPRRKSRSRRPRGRHPCQTRPKRGRHDCELPQWVKGRGADGAGGAAKQNPEAASSSGWSCSHHTRTPKRRSMRRRLLCVRPSARSRSRSAPDCRRSCRPRVGSGTEAGSSHGTGRTLSRPRQRARARVVYRRCRSASTGTRTRRRLVASLLAGAPQWAADRNESPDWTKSTDRSDSSQWAQSSQCAQSSHWTDTNGSEHWMTMAHGSEESYHGRAKAHSWTGAQGRKRLEDSESSSCQLPGFFALGQSGMADSNSSLRTEPQADSLSLSLESDGWSNAQSRQNKKANRSKRCGTRGQLKVNKIVRRFERSDTPYPTAMQNAAVSFLDSVLSSRELI